MGKIAFDNYLQNYGGGWGKVMGQLLQFHLTTFNVLIH